MSSKAIIFGSSGQDGYYLKKLLKNKNVETISISRTGEDFIGDVRNFTFVKAQVKKHQPTYIFHLAANSTTDHAALFENHETISTGTLNILEAAYQYSRNSKVFLSGSGLQFKNEGQPIMETDSFEARSPYSLSRIHSVYAARYYRNLGIKVYVGYLFNHDSPLRAEKHINQKIASAVKKIAGGKPQKLSIGNIDVKKEFTFAGDVVEAIWCLITNDKCYEAVIGSGNAYSIKDWLRICFEKHHLDWQKYVEINYDFVPEYKILVSNPKTIFSLGWTPQTDIHKLAEMMLK